jgi:hypothetical protein
MAQAALERILDEIKTLDPKELQEVERVVRSLLEPSSKEAEREAVLRVLQNSGLVKEIKRPPMDVARERPLGSVQGKPISETIIEERR